MSLTDAQSDHITDIMFNLEGAQLDQAVAALNAGERAALRAEAVALANRLIDIACRAEGRTK
jgi:hypothetical protein